MKRAARFKTGSVVFDRRRRTWNYLWWEAGKRRSKRLGTVREYPTKSAAWLAAKSLQQPPEKTQPSTAKALTIGELVEQDRTEKMPRRVDTRRSYDVWLRNHVIPKWGACVLTDVQATRRVLH